MRKNLPASPVMLETGAGNSTICFLLLEPKRLVSVAPDAKEFERIRAYCADHKISAAPLEAHISGSEWVLPQMAYDLRDQPPVLDFALIDGSHNWPMVFVDFFFANHMLKTDGLIMIDDLQLHTVKELGRMLSEQPEFKLELDIDKSMVFWRVGDARILGEWPDLPYIVRKTKEYAETPNPFSLYPDVNTRKIRRGR